MSEVFFASDSHYGHSNIIRYCDRPFQDVAEMNEHLITKWNSVVSKNDTVYHLGDFCFKSERNPIEYRSRLNGKIILVLGNHDPRNNGYYNLFDECHDSFLEKKINGKLIVMCHYPLFSWRGSSHGQNIHCFGHVHSGPYKPMRFMPNSYDVGVDNNNYTPVHFDQLLINIEENKKNKEPIVINVDRSIMV